MIPAAANIWLRIVFHPARAFALALALVRTVAVVDEVFRTCTCVNAFTVHIRPIRRQISRHQQRRLRHNGRWAQREKRIRKCGSPSTSSILMHRKNTALSATTSSPPTSTSALTERQLQFWADVDDGLKDIEIFYRKQGQNIDRIRTFALRARGKLPLPISSAWDQGHRPSEEYVDGLTARPFWSVDAFPWAHVLEDKSSIIVKEFENILQQQNAEDESFNVDNKACREPPSIGSSTSTISKMKNLFAGDSAWQNQVMGDGWSAVRLQRLGVWNVENCQKFPATYALLRSLAIPLAVRGVCFARQSPQSGIQPHSDGRNFILTAHLGLKIPPECSIQVGDVSNRRNWKVGKLIILDTSFQHSTDNLSDEDRYVLILDFWHPEVTKAEQAALAFIYDLRNKFESGQVSLWKPRKLMNKELFQHSLSEWWSSIVGTREETNDET